MRKVRLGVVVPYRRRPHHLEPFLDRTKRFLDRTGIDYKIIIISQDDAKAFNRGILCNIGYKEAKKYRCDYVAFHDVDTIPLDVDYSYPDKPIHLASDDLPFESYFGGITLFNNNDFEKINGFSNEYWGWGYEDDDLLYRCIRHGIPLDSRKVKINTVNTECVNFNGVNSFAKINNILNTKKDFKIKTTVQIGELTFNQKKEVDVYPIFNIRGYDFELVYTSFRRLNLKFFDNTGRFLQIYTNITKEKQFNIEIIYKAKKKLIQFYVNKEKVGEEEMFKPLYNYTREKNIYLGADNELNNFFSGIIKNFTIINDKEEIITDLDCTKIKEYQLEDKSPTENNAVLFNTPIVIPNIEKIQTLHFPFRRKSKNIRLEHPTSGFNGGRWASDLTRWNELKFYNEVSKGFADTHEDGLSTLKYMLHSRIKSDDRKTITINIGI